MAILATIPHGKLQPSRWIGRSGGDNWVRIRRKRRGQMTIAVDIEGTMKKGSYLFGQTFQAH